MHTVKTTSLKFLSILAILSVSACTQAGGPEKPQTPPDAENNGIPSAEVTMNVPALSSESTEATGIAASIVKPDPVKASKDISVGVTLYMVQNNKVVPVNDNLQARTASAELVMKRLLEGPNADQKAQSISSAIPENTKLNSIEMKETIAVVDLSKEFESNADEQSLKMRVSQVVHTLGNLFGVEAVEFKIDGKEVDSLGSGSLKIKGPQTADMWPL